MNQEFTHSDMQCMKVTKRNGKLEEVSFDKVLRRIKNLSSDLTVNTSVVAQKINSQIFDGVTTAQLDELSAEICAHMTTVHPDYGTLASRIIISNHHKNTSPSLSEVAQTLWNFKDINGKDCPLINKKLYHLINSNKEKLNSVLNYQLDYRLNYFGFKTLERAYLLSIKEYYGKKSGKKKVIERPQHMYMRVALAIHGKNIKEAIKSYKLMAEGYFTHATPTLYNLGTNREQASSCFLLSMASDSIEGIYDTLKRCALISKNAGGIGLSIHNVRASGSLIRGTNGTSNGIVPMLRVFNNTARYVDQGGSKRNGSFAIYIEPWHADIEDYLMLKRNTGFEENRARDLFYAMWIPDLFMKRVKADADWTLMCPDECPGLYDLYGEEFERQYEQYEKEGRGRKTIKAREIWLTILESQIETGTPYILYKDACNRKSNQKNLGTIRSSNLCAEIVEYSSADEIAVCNLASIALPRYVENGVFNFQKLEEVTAVAVRNLNKIIDINHYPVGETKNSNLKHRPIGVGVQGLADVFALMRISFDSPEAQQLNKKIFEHMYWGALNCSMEISRERQPLMVKYKHLWLKRKNKQEPFSKEDKIIMKELKDQLWLGGIKPLEYEYNRSKYKNNSSDICSDNYLGAYSSFEGSPTSTGILQYDMWEVEPNPEMKPRFDTLKEEITKWGTRNSLLMALMPTASTSQILGNNECFEPYTSNIYKRRTLAGEFKIINKHLLKDLIRLGIWNQQIKDQIILNEGSIQNIDEIPNDIKKIYKTVWEMKQRILIDMATDRGAFICQTQSLNLFMAHPTFSKLSKMHFYGWEKGLKTGIYYLRSLATAKAQQFTIDPNRKPGENGNCDRSDPTCEACSA